ncbi:hypothetical protein O181_070480 [Austropuccinia psidii MF-1]|uniref:Reverse transcriptase domain-containing protein n=1 Tax=Austropuccinia psidii MF-1 TaxID=1389203 RepID=A0A9Q3F4X0_9BASI|nr:hypothetical protein [Austropuccinia psidii MF-1]
MDLPPEPEEIETVIKVVPSVYHQYLDLFSKVKAEKLPPHHAYDHHIKLEGSLLPAPKSQIHSGPTFQRMKNKYLVPPMNQPLNFLNGSAILSKIDLHCSYNLLRIKEGDEHLTAFRTKNGSYEYLVMPFGLTNAPASFQNLVNDILQYLLDVYVVVYLDDIMVFYKSEEEHFTHLSTVLSRIRANTLFAKASNFLFHVSSVEYLGYVVSAEALKMNQVNVEQILNWPPPRNHKALQSFLGFVNFYHCFIKYYSKKISSLTSFLKEDSCFPLKEAALIQFHQLKEAFTTAPILLYQPLWRLMHLIMPRVLYSVRSMTQENIPLHSTAASLFQQSSTMRFMTRNSLA